MTRKTIAIMQPTYLPWPGFFELILQSQAFIFLDDAKLEKSSWHVRNKILVNQAPNFLTVELNASRLSTIHESALAPTSWRRKHAQSLRLTYNKAPYSKEILDLIVPIIENGTQASLADLNIELILAFCGYLGIKTQFLRSSEMGVEGKKSGRLIELCRKLEADHYYSPVGSKDYIDEEALFPSSGIALTYQDFPSTPYAQFNSKEFVPYLSVVDLIANTGPQASAYIKRSSPK